MTYRPGELEQATDEWLQMSLKLREEFALSADRLGYPAIAAYNRADAEQVRDEIRFREAGGRAEAAARRPARRPRRPGGVRASVRDGCQATANSERHAGSRRKSIAPRSSAAHRSLTSRPSSSASPRATARSPLLSVSRRRPHSPS